jgi:hypothetical protein
MKRFFQSDMERVDNTNTYLQYCKVTNELEVSCVCGLWGRSATITPRSALGCLVEAFCSPPFMGNYFPVIIDAKVAREAFYYTVILEFGGSFHFWNFAA